jgi:hypothetical protein
VVPKIVHQDVPMEREGDDVNRDKIDTINPPVKMRRTKCLSIQGMAEFRYAISFV